VPAYGYADNGNNCFHLFNIYRRLLQNGLVYSRLCHPA
jgi:hypothetical protein